jgi:transposase
LTGNSKRSRWSQPGSGRRELREPEQYVLGVGPILAGKIIGRVGNVARFPTKAHYFASYTGTELPSRPQAARWYAIGSREEPTASSTTAPHMIAICQARHDTEGRAYYRRKLAEGESEKEALRCLKRRISDAAYKHLRADSEGAISVAA